MSGRLNCHIENQETSLEFRSNVLVPNTHTRAEVKMPPPFFHEERGVRFLTPLLALGDGPILSIRQLLKALSLHLSVRFLRSICRPKALEM